MRHKVIGCHFEGAAQDNIHIVGNVEVDFINTRSTGAGRHNLYIAGDHAPIPKDLFVEIEKAVRAGLPAKRVKSEFGEDLRKLGYDLETLLSAGASGLTLLAALAPYVRG